MGTWLPVVIGAAFVWLVYRAGQWNERQGVIRGLEAELKMHEGWVGGTGFSEKDRGSWDPDYMVYKLSTVAIDNAIARGPGLFLNRNLTVALVSYRQVVGHLNQLIDKATDFQVVAELWRNPRPPGQVRSAMQLVESVHIQGIGNATLEQKPAAHALFMLVMEHVRLENESRALRIAWAITALNLSFLRDWFDWLAARLQQARRFAVAAVRRIARTAPSPVVLTPAQPHPVEALPQRAPLSTSADTQSRGVAVPFDIIITTSSAPSASTGNWLEHARLPIPKRKSSHRAAEAAVKQRKAKSEPEVAPEAHTPE